jgi:hypothetical protein
LNVGGPSRTYRHLCKVFTGTPRYAATSAVDHSRSHVGSGVGPGARLRDMGLTSWSVWYSPFAVVLPAPQREGSHPAAGAAVALPKELRGQPRRACPCCLGRLVLLSPSLAGGDLLGDGRRERSERITGRAIEGILDQVRELSDLGLVPQVNVQARAHGIPPVFKMYLLNNDEVFFGFYPVVERTVSIKGEPVAIYDLLGKDVPLFHYATDAADERDTRYVDAARQWFESVWSTVAHDWEA